MRSQSLQPTYISSISSEKIFFNLFLIQKQDLRMYDEWLQQILNDF